MTDTRHPAPGENATRWTTTPNCPGTPADSPSTPAIRALGRTGIAGIADRCCALARRFAEQLAVHDGVEILNPVVLNQVLLRFRAPDGHHDRHTRAVVQRVQQEGTCWMSATTWRGQAAMRISVTKWSTDEADVDTSVAAILRHAHVASQR